MTSEFDSLQSRGRALEEAFFHERDRQLIASLHRRFSAEETEKVLAAAIGIADELMLKAVTKVEAGVEVLAAMALMPMVAVAWCDGEVSTKEREAVLRGAVEMGIAVGSPGYELLQRWLEKAPAPEAIEAWHKYVKTIVGTMEPATAKRCCDKIMTRAENVAKAAGGFLGFGNKISEVEQKCLADLRASFGA